MFELHSSADIKAEWKEPICKDYLPLVEGVVNMIAAPGGTGKTFIGMRVTLYYLMEKPFAKALIWGTEDELGLLKMREQALVEEMRRAGVQADTLRLAYKNDYSKFTCKRGGVIEKTDYFREARKALLGYDLIVLDPLLNFFGGESENDNMHAREFIGVLMQWAREEMKTVVVIHHGRKEDGKTRGASAFVDSCRLCYEISKSPVGVVATLIKDNYGVKSIVEAEIPIETVPPKTCFPIPDEKPGVSDVVTFSLSKEMAEGFKPKTAKFEELAKLVSADCNYSATQFRDEYRDSEHALQGQTLMILDFDEGLTLEDGLTLFGDYRAIVATTKSHRKDKNGVVSDRFRVLIQCDKPITLDSKQYSMMMREVLQAFPEADASCKDIARMWGGYTESEGFITPGKRLFDWGYYWTKAQARDKMERDEYERFKKDYGLNGTEESRTKAYETLMQKDWHVGNRNNCLNRIAFLMDKDGTDEIRDRILKLNASQNDPLPDREVNIILRRYR